MKYIVFLVIAVLLMGVAPAAAKTYTLDECIQMAKNTDPGLNRFRNAIKTANMAVWVQAGEFLPTFSVSGSYAKVDQGETSPQIRDLGGGVIEIVPSLPATTYKGYSAGYNVGYTLFNGLQNVWNYLGSRASKRYAEYSYTQAESDLLFVIKTQYNLVLKAKRDYEVAKETLKRSEELLKLFEEKYELGSASRSEVLKQKVQYGNDQLTVVTKKRGFETNLGQLALMIGLNPYDPISIEDIPLKTQKIDDVEVYLRRAAESHPRLLGAKAEMDASKYDVRSAWGTYLPRLSLGYSFGWNKDRFDEIKKFGPYDHSGRLSLNLSWNIFDGFAREYNMTRAKATLSNAKYTYRYNQNYIVRDIQTAYTGILQSEETLKVTEETEKAASEDFDLVQAKYNLGAAALWELLDAQVSLKSAQFDKVKAEFDYNLALALLQNAMGE